MHCKEILLIRDLQPALNFPVILLWSVKTVSWSLKFNKSHRICFSLMVTMPRLSLSLYSIFKLRNISTSLFVCFPLPSFYCHQNFLGWLKILYLAFP